MKVKVLYYCLGLGILLSACTAAPKSEKKLPLEKKIVYPVELNKQLNAFPNLDLGLVMDSVFLDSLNGKSFKHGKKLDMETVKFLTVKMNRDDLTEPNYYYLNDFYKIEQYKKKGKYNDFLDSLDIGMTKDANCYAIGKMEYGDSLALLIWQLNYSSYEACPFFSGSHIFGTIVFNGKVKRTMQFAAYESAMDAPMTSETYQLFRVSKSGIIDRSEYIKVLEDSAVVEDVKHFYINRLTTQGFIKL